MKKKNLIKIILIIEEKIIRKLKEDYPNQNF